MTDFKRGAKNQGQIEPPGPPCDVGRGVLPRQDEPGQVSGHPDGRLGVCVQAGAPGAWLQE